MQQRRIYVGAAGLAAALALGVVLAMTAGATPIHVTYLWHMHQPVYYPYESLTATDANGRYNFSVAGVHNERGGNYQTWPKEAVEQGHGRAGLEHSGAQVSFSGSLGENLNNLWGNAGSSSWDDAYDYARNTLRTSMDNPRLDMVGIAYHHSLMPLTCKESMKMQIRLHKELYRELWDTAGYSKGFWPPECAFATWIIPALVEEGLEWVLVDNGHFDRACRDYPWVPATSVRPNAADQLNPDPADHGSEWVQLNNVWAPSKVSAPWGYQPHWVKYVNPWSGVEQKMVAVPCGRYEGNENGRGGYGAFKPQNVWGDKVAKNNDAARPMIIVCHSDGDNFGMKNSDAFHGQHGDFLNMCQSNGDFDNTTVQDYLGMYPVPANDVIHVEPGSWIGIDGGTPYFDKWREWNPGFRGDPNEHPDYWSWSVIVAAQNRVLHADRLESGYSMNDVQWGINSDTAKAWHFYLQGETSCHWYWDYDRDNPWDGNTTRACNLAVTEANKVLARHPGQDPQPPSIFPPQRSSHNPGGFLYNELTRQPSDFQVWSFVDDASGLAAVRLYVRADLDNQNPIGENDNEVYGPSAAKVSAWTITGMTNEWYPKAYGPKVPPPGSRAQMWSASVTGRNNVLLDYFVEAVDAVGNTNRSDIMHVFVGEAMAGPTVAFSPTPAEACAPLTIAYDATGRSLAGVVPVKVQLDWEPSVSVPVAADMEAAGSNRWTYVASIPADQTNLVVYFHNGAGTVDNNGGLNWSAAIGACSTGPAAVVTFDPPAPDGCTAVTIRYQPNTGPLQGATNVYIHAGRNGWQDVLLPNPVMTSEGGGTWAYTYSVPVGTWRIDCVFNNGMGQWDNNQGNDFRVLVANCAASQPDVYAVAGSPTVAPDPAGENTPGEAFDLATNGNAAVTSQQGGFGSFGQVYVNADSEALYLGGIGVDMAGDNNAAILFLSIDTLADNANNLWARVGKPAALGSLHNVWFNNPAPDLALVLGSEYGDGTFEDFDLANGYNMGQGVYRLAATSFVAVAGVTLAQFDGVGTNAVSGGDDGDLRTERWECRIPWAALGASGVADVGSLHLSGLFVSDGTNGVDRYISGNCLGTPRPGTNGNYGYAFVTLDPVAVLVPQQDSDGDGLPDAWEEAHFHSPTGAARDLDSDGDGHSNWEEYRLGTQPTNMQSRLRLTSLLATGSVTRIQWSTVGGRWYGVDVSEDLMQGFTPVTNVAEDDVAAGTESEEMLEAAVPLSGATNRFRAYRIWLSEP